jgi:hypothetical protein
MSEIKTQEGLTLTEFKYRFKKDDLGVQRPGVSLMVPTLTLKMISQIALGTTKVKDEKTGVEYDAPTKEALLIKEAVDAIYQEQIRGIVNEKEDVSQANFPMDKATWEYIANMEPKDRRGAGIPKEQWEAFAADYCKVMPAITGKSDDATSGAAQVLVRKFRDAAGNLPVVQKLLTYLAMYAEAPGSKAEEFVDIIEFLSKKGKDMLDAKDKVVALDNL